MSGVGLAGRQGFAGVVVVLASGAVLCGCSVSDPPSPPILGIPQEPNQSGEQAETDLVVARTPAGSTNLVVGHRFTGPFFFNNNASSGLDIFYTDQTLDGVVFRRGSSIMGYSFSQDGGYTWQAPGKVYPQFVHGEPTALLWSDPALAVGFTNPSLVAYASLAVSTSSFDALTLGTDTEDLLSGWPPDLDTPEDQGIVDSICVALSFDGGVNFDNEVVCAREPDIGLTGTDQTTTAIGAGNRVYVAADDFTPDEILLYELVYTGVPVPFLKRLPVDAMMLDASHGPELRRDQGGEVWMSGTSAGGTIKLCHVTTTGCEFVGDVSSGVDLFAQLPSGVASGEALRSASSGDFAVNRLALGDLSVREFIFAYSRSRPTDFSPYVGVTRCFMVSLAGGISCEDVDAWGTGLRAGMQLQPNIEFVDKSAAQDGSGADWRYAFYEFARPEIATAHAQVTLATLSGPLPASAFPTVGFQPLPGPDPAVCPANYPFSDYWGDYFGLAAVQNPDQSWRHVAVYSSDEARGCEPHHPRQARNLHVVAWGWND
ncbi:MAG: hypothetical protein R3B13_27160 [Polyangiaceae bacterium]